MFSLWKEFGVFNRKPIEKSLLIHGLVLFFVLLIVSIPSIVINFSMPSIPVAIVVFIVYCFIDGYVARAVGNMGEEIDRGEDSSDSPYAESLETSHFASIEPTVHEPFAGTEEADAELLYDKLMTKYIDHWGVQTGTQLLNNEIKAYTWQGETFEEAEKRVSQRQKRRPPK
jgi:hypothetical protein